jgi:hypothetical protein
MAEQTLRDEIEAAFQAAWRSLTVLERFRCADGYYVSSKEGGSPLRSAWDDWQDLARDSSQLLAELRKRPVHDAFAIAAVRLRLPAAKSCGLDAVHAHLLVGLLGQMALHRYDASLDGWRAVGSELDEGLAVRLQQEYYGALDRMEPDEKWSDPDSPSEWAKKFRMSLSTLKRRIDDGKIKRQVVTAQRWRIRVADVDTWASK